MNRFDAELNGYALDGIFGSLKKAWGKAKKAVTKARDKVAKATGTYKIVKQAGKSLTSASRNPAVRVAAAVAATYFVGPAALTALKAGAGAVGGVAKGAMGMAAKAVGGKVAAGGIIKTAGGALVKLGSSGAVSQLASAALKNQLQKRAVDSQIQTAEQMAQLNADAANIAAIASDPSFAGTYAAMRAEGATLQQIQNEWGKSRTYKETAVPEIMKTIQPMLERMHLLEGKNAELAKNLATIESAKIAEQEVNKIAGVDTKLLIAIGMPLAIALISQK